MAAAEVTSIRRLTDGDIDPVTTIANQALARGESTWGPEPLTTAEVKAMLLGLEPRFESYVCVNGQGDVVGWAALRPHTNRPVYNVSGEIEVFVAAEWRRRGVGRLLIHHLLERAEALQYHALVALMQPVPTPPLSWAIRLGFRAVGALSAVIPVAGVWRDMLVFEKFLPAKAESHHAP